MSDNVLVKSDGPITRITLNRPEKRNAMSLDLMADLTGTLEAVRHDDDTRVVVIAASGPAFSAGHDLERDGIRIETQSPTAGCSTAARC